MPAECPRRVLDLSARLRIAVMHVQLDPVGGIAGDMFSAAVLDAWPEFEPALVAALERAGIDAVATVERVDHTDHVLTGSRFAVHETAASGHEGRLPARPDHDAHEGGGQGPGDAASRHRHPPGGGTGPHAHDAGGGDGDRTRSPGDAASRHRHPPGGDTGPHGHDAGGGGNGDGDRTSRGPGHVLPHPLYRDIRALLGEAELESGVRARALDVFARLAAAESAVHGVPVEEVSFHEVGACDSIADVVCAAWLIERLDATWSCGPLPIGRGRVETSHGRIPIPAPATVELLRGMLVEQDAHHGERVTPTGAAIVAHLAPSFEPLPGPMRLDRCGTGFGTSRLPGASNVLRLLAFDTAVDASGIGRVGGPGGPAYRERIAVCEFEVDDQTGEDLALALDRFRDLEGVLDVSSHAMHAKKGRLAMHVRLLVGAAAVEPVIDSCFRETTTLGVRWHEVSRVALPRESAKVTVEGRSIRVKSALRPGGVRTSKAEIDDLAPTAGGHAVRERVRASAERTGPDDGGRA